jgi:hypothetical protein
MLLFVALFTESPILESQAAQLVGLPPGLGELGSGPLLKSEEIHIFYLGAKRPA